MTTISQSMQTAFSLLESTKINPETGLLLNYTDDHAQVHKPTSEDYRDGKPNHLGWNTPTEDGGYYNGLYLDALICRAKYLNDESAAKAARRVAMGLLKLSELGPEGFIARCWCEPDKAHYLCGSDDQTFPWLYGMWRFIRSGIGTAWETQECVKAFVRVGNALKSMSFRIPCADLSYGWRGDYRGSGLRNIAKLGFVCISMYDITKDPKWFELYERNWSEAPEGCKQTRLEMIRDTTMLEKYDGESVFYCLKDGEAMEKVFGERRKITGLGLFLIGMVHFALNVLMQLDTDSGRISIFRAALSRDAEPAATHMPRYRELKRLKWPTFSDNWQAMNLLWKPQHTMKETADMAWQQMPVWFETCPRFPFENAFVREPLYAACIVAFSDDMSVLEAHRNDITELLTYIPWEKLNTSTYYAALLAHGQLLRNGFFKE